MEKVLVAGVNTRAVACSLKKLGYQVYSADYFGTMDLRTCVDKFLSALDQKPQKSCGRFTQCFNPLIIEKMALEMAGDADGIICCAGVSPAIFPSKKIMGNTRVDTVEDKYRLMKKLQGKFHVPETHLIKDMEDARDIASSDPDKRFVLKPRYGSGGYGIRFLNEILKRSSSDSNCEMDASSLDVNFELDDGGWILQEFIQGENASASVLATGTDARTILTSSQIIGDKVLGQREPFGYCGNIVPYNGDTYLGENHSGSYYRDSNHRDKKNGDSCRDDSKISEIAQKVVSHLSLTGSNGVDFMIRNGEVFVIEVNPRLQGTFECAELALDINMAEAHLEASQGHLMNIPPPSKFAVKMVIHAHHRSQVGNLNFDGVCDLPNKGVIIEKGEPVATVLTSSTTREDALYSARKIVQRVYKSIKPEI
ncbi:MAG: ATP-grasp domain-containing protein [Methanobacteriaceae archaeon]|nr:ATP-grasp domain-containing protein [Methanobacteriaceae archaeon]